MTTRNSIIASRSVRCRATVLVVASALLLTGCGGDAPGDTGSASPSATTAATASATPTPTQTPVYRPADASGPAQNVPVPVLPEVAKTETKEGLEAFARYWFELLSYGYETGDVEKISEITSDSCVMCERSKEVQTGWHDGGRWLSGGKVTTPSVSTTFRPGPDGSYQVAVQVSQDALSYYNADGSLDSAEPKPADSGSLMLAGYRDGAWVVNTIEPIGG